MTSSLTSSTLTLGSRSYTSDMFTGEYRDTSDKNTTISGDIGFIQVLSFSLLNSVSGYFRVTASSGSWVASTVQGGSSPYPRAELGSSFEVSSSESGRGGGDLHPSLLIVNTEEVI